MSIEKIIEEIAASAGRVAELTGHEQAAELLNLIGTASHGYEVITGSPVDPALVPKIERLA